MKIRRGTPADLAEVQRLNKGLYDYENSRGFYADGSFDLGWTYGEAGTKYFTDRLGPDPGGAVFMVEDDGPPVGYLAAAYRTSSYRSQNPIAEIENMFVEEAYRRRHAGRQLVEAFKDWAKNHGVARLKVGAFAANGPALKFYRSCGFTDLELVLEQKA